MTEKENHLPNLSSEERAHALELAMQARRRYAALKARVKSGELTFTDAMDEEDAKRILVTSLLQSVAKCSGYRCEQGGSHHATVPDTERQACRRTRHPAT